MTTFDTYIDLTIPRLRRRDFYEPISNAALPHQIQIVWRFAKTVVQGVCNCGVNFALKDPTNADALAETMRAYALHVEDICRQEDT